MAFGIPAYHEEDVTIPFAIYDDWIAHVTSLLGWSFKGREMAGPFGQCWKAETSMNLSSWGEKITFTPIGPTTLRVRSECRLPTQMFDWGRNKKNVDRFKEVLQSELMRAAPR